MPTAAGRESAPCRRGAARKRAAPGARGYRPPHPPWKLRSQVLHLIGNRVEGRMAVDLVARRLEQRLGLLGIGGHDVRRAHHPDADALLAAGIDIARVLDRHAHIGGMEAPDVLVLESRARAD